MQAELRPLGIDALDPQLSGKPALRARRPALQGHLRSGVVDRHQRTRSRQRRPLELRVHSAARREYVVAARSDRRPHQRGGRIDVRSKRRASGSTNKRKRESARSSRRSSSIGRPHTTGSTPTCAASNRPRTSPTRGTRGSGRSDMFAQITNVRGGARLHFEPARSGVLSWNTYASGGTLRFRLLRAGEPASAWYDYVQWMPSGRKSYSPQSDRDGVTVDVDVITATTPFDGIEARVRRRRLQPHRVRRAATTASLAALRARRDDSRRARVHAIRRRGRARLVQPRKPRDGQRVSRHRAQCGDDRAAPCSIARTTGAATGRSIPHLAAAWGCARRSSTCAISTRPRS